MAAIPNNYGGNRDLLADPNTAGTGVALSDVATISLNFLHLVDPVMAAQPGWNAQRDRLAEGLRNVLTATDAFKTREGSTRVLQPMSRIPNAWGLTANLAQVRTNQLPQFDGLSKDPREVVRWLNRMIQTAQSHTLDQNTTINLLIACSSGSAYDAIDRWKGENRQFDYIARSLELRFGDLCTPDEAVIKVNTMPRLADEPLALYLDRLRHMAAMAKRGIADDAERQAAIDSLVESNVRRALPTSVKESLENRILTRAQASLPPLSLAEIEKECIELERKRTERLAKKLDPRQRAPAKPFGLGKGINAVQLPQAFLYQVEGTGYSSDSDDEVANDSGYNLEADPEAVAFINAAQYVANKYQAKGRPLGQDKVWEKAAKRMGRLYPQQQQPKYPQGGPRKPYPYQGQQARPQYQEKAQARQVAAHQQGQQPRPMAPPNPAGAPPTRIQPGARLNIKELLARGNCMPGECLRCGRQGHNMSSDACPLRGKPLVDKACITCNKGLHGADDCLMAFQQQPPAAVHQVQFEYSDLSDDLNED